MGEAEAKGKGLIQEGRFRVQATRGIQHHDDKKESGQVGLKRQGGRVGRRRGGMGGQSKD